MDPKANNLFFQRMFFSSLWNLFLQSLLIGVFLFCLHVNLINPLIWIKDWLNCIFNWRTGLYLIPLLIVIIAQGLVCAKIHTSVQPFYPTRFSLTIQLLSLQNIINSFLHIFIGFVTVWLYLSITGGHLGSFIHSNGILNEDRLFFILSGVWVNLCYFLKNHFSGENYLLFPVVQQSKFAQIKSHLLSTIKSSIPEVFIPNCLFIIIYYCRGYVVRDFVSVSLGLKTDKPIDTFEGLANIWRLGSLWLFSSIVVSSMKLMEFLYKIYLTEREIFQISGSLILKENSLTLEEALKKSDYPFIHHLAFLDLFKLSENSQTRRAHIFALSQPGGHPHTWNTVKNECFRTIDNFSSSLSELLIFRQIKETAKETYNRYGVADCNSPNTSVNQPQIWKPSYMDLIYNKISFTIEEINAWIQVRMSWWINLPIVVYLFGDRKDLKIKYILRQSQPVLWACHSLSHLTVHSLIEDNFGIVQNDLAKVIYTLLKLRQTLESVEKHVSKPVDPCTVSKYKQTLKNGSVSAYAINKSVKRSIYRISNAFKDYITDLQLPRDAEIQMTLFAEYKV